MLAAIPTFAEAGDGGLPSLSVTWPAPPPVTAWAENAEIKNAWSKDGYNFAVVRLELLGDRIEFAWVRCNFLDAAGAVVASGTAGTDDTIEKAKAVDPAVVSINLSPEEPQGWTGGVVPGRHLFSVVTVADAAFERVDCAVSVR